MTVSLVMDLLKRCGQGDASQGYHSIHSFMCLRSSRYWSSLFLGKKACQNCEQSVGSESGSDSSPSSSSSSSWAEWKL